MTDAAPQDFLVKRDKLREARFAPAALAVGDGQVLLKVDSFALTANNITYAVFGDAMQYWNFFPAADPAWGRIPVWGHADVVESKHPEVTAGERVYGYLPMSTHLVVQPARVTPEGFLDGVAHRRPLPVVYQQYTRCARDPLHDPRREAERALLNPLFATSFLIEDFLGDNALFGASQVVLASASSKTALGVAFLLSRNRPQGARVVGLTSPRNRGFCDSVGYYDEVLAYDDVAAMDHSHATVFVDMAGDGKLLAAVHNHFRDALKYSCIVGATHWEDRATQHRLPGARPQFFFAPTQAQKRRQDWGPGGMEQRFGQAWAAFLPSVAGWLKVRRGRGAGAIHDTYMDVLEGRASPETGHVLSF
jgi:hypothetical protein